MTLTVQQIYNDLNPDWWSVDTLPSGIECPSTMLYWTDEAGNIDSFMSTGVLGDPDNQTDYITNYLMWEAARQLANGQCVGSITNIAPKSYNPLPIYFK